MTDELADPEASGWVKRAAQIEMESLISARQAITEQAASMSKWLLASLLAVNGGGAAATLGAIQSLEDPVCPASFFVAGIMFALLNGVAIQYAGFAIMKPLSEMIGYWLSVVDDGERVETIEQEHQNTAKGIARMSRLCSLLGWLSALLFLLGAVSLCRTYVSPP